MFRLEVKNNRTHFSYLENSILNTYLSLDLGILVKHRIKYKKFGFCLDEVWGRKQLFIYSCKIHSTIKINNNQIPRRRASKFSKKNKIQIWKQYKRLNSTT